MMTVIDVFMNEKMGIFTCLDCDERVVTETGLSYASMELQYRAFENQHEHCK